MAESNDSKILEEAWTHVARRYREYWSPRFEPYLKRAVELFEPPPHGPLAIAGCGPGDEILHLAAKFPGRSIMATDLSPGMVALAARRVREAGLTNVLVAEDDAAGLTGRIRQAAGIFSAFVLQLLPNPVAALADWSRALRQEGCLAVLFWPRLQGCGAFARLQRLLRERTGDNRPEWEEKVMGELPRLGLRLVSEETLEQEMEHRSPQELWDELRDSGPLQAVLRRIGEKPLAQLAAEWLEDPGLEHRGEVWIHRPPARLWLLERSDKITRAPSG